MKNKVIKYCLDNNLINNNDKIIVALSGGADSVSLFHLLLEMKEEFNLDIYCAHLNHMLRGEDADNDMHFVEDLCKEYNVKLFTRCVDIKSIAKEKKISEELAGRIERYKFFDELSSELSAKVATAHTASDNCETVLFNITRGASLKGASGIPSIRENIIRPILTLTRDDIEEYCKSNNYSFVTDKTNFENEYSRNKIRNQVVPVLKTINPDFEASVLKFSNNNKEIYEYISKVVDEKLLECKTDYGYDVEKMLSQDRLILKYIIMRILSDFGADYENKHIDLIIKSMNETSTVELKNGYKAVSKQNIFRVVLEKDESKTHENVLCSNKLKLVTKDSFSNYRKSELISFDSVNENTVLRNREPKDTFSFKGRNVTKTLKKLLNEEKIPSELRDNLLVVANGSTILWCELIGTSSDGMIDDNTNKAFIVEGIL